MDPGRSSQTSRSLVCINPVWAVNSLVLAVCLVLLLWLMNGNYLVCGKELHKFGSKRWIFHKDELCVSVSRLYCRPTLLIHSQLCRISMLTACNVLFPVRNSGKHVQIFLINPSVYSFSCIFTAVVSSAILGRLSCILSHFISIHEVHSEWSQIFCSVW